MAKEEKEGFDWKNLEESVKRDSVDSGDGVSAKKSRLRRLRPLPEHYFIPRRSLTYNIFFYGAFIAGGIGAGMLVEKWINKKVKEDGGVIWEFDK